MQEKNNPIGSTHFQSRLFSLCLTGLESVNGTTVLGKLDRQFTGRKQLSNSFTAVAIAILTQETPAGHNQCTIIVSLVSCNEQI